MKTPYRQTYAFPGRYSVSNEPYQIDWSALMEDGESVAGVDLEMVRGDTVIDRITTTDDVTTFWLSGGTSRLGLQQMRASCTSTKGETDAILVTFAVPA